VTPLASPATVGLFDYERCNDSGLYTLVYAYPHSVVLGVAFGCTGYTLDDVYLMSPGLDSPAGALRSRQWRCDFDCGDLSSWRLPAAWIPEVYAY